MFSFIRCVRYVRVMRTVFVPSPYSPMWIRRIPHRPFSCPIPFPSHMRPCNGTIGFAKLNEMVSLRLTQWLIESGNKHLEIMKQQSDPMGLDQELVAPPQIPVHIPWRMHSGVYALWYFSQGIYMFRNIPIHPWNTRIPWNYH